MNSEPIVKFNNCLYSMENHKVVKSDEPVFTVVESNYNYNPYAKPVDIYYNDGNDSINIEEFLNQLFERNVPAETEKYVKGVLQVLGYLFTSGTSHKNVIFQMGVGSGKSTLSNMIKAIFSKSANYIPIVITNCIPTEHHIKRAILIEFMHDFRNTQIENLSNLFINSAESMEWLIYNSLKAYKEMEANKENFILKLNTNKEGI